MAEGVAKEETPQARTGLPAPGPASGPPVGKQVTGGAGEGAVYAGSYSRGKLGALGENWGTLGGDWGTTRTTERALRATESTGRGLEHNGRVLGSN